MMKMPFTNDIKYDTFKKKIVHMFSCNEMN